MLIYRWFRCEECGAVMMFAKKKHRRAERDGHIKDVYCGVCNKVTKWKIIDYKRVY